MWPACCCEEQDTLTNDVYSLYVLQVCLKKSVTTEGSGNENILVGLIILQQNQGYISKLDKERKDIE